MSRSPGAQADRRLADRRGAPARRVTTSSRPRVLERDEHGHQLRDARDRHAWSGASLASSTSPVVAVLDEERARLHLPGRGEHGSGERERRQASGDEQRRRVERRQESTRQLTADLARRPAERVGSTPGFSASSSPSTPRSKRSAERVSRLATVSERGRRRPLSSSPGSDVGRVCRRCVLVTVVVAVGAAWSVCSAGADEQDGDRHRERGRGAERRRSDELPAPVHVATSRRRPRPRAQPRRLGARRPRASRRSARCGRRR